MEQLYAVQPTMAEPDYTAAFSLLHGRARKRAIAANLLMNREEALSTLRQRGAAIVDALPQNLTVSAVNRYLALKARGRL